MEQNNRLYSNASQYNCPMCKWMNEERMLSTCMVCMQGDKFVQRELTSLEKDSFGY